MERGPWNVELEWRNFITTHTLETSCYSQRLSNIPIQILFQLFLVQEQQPSHAIISAFPFRVDDEDKNSHKIKKNALQNNLFRSLLRSSSRRPPQQWYAAAFLSKLHLRRTLLDKIELTMCFPIKEMSENDVKLHF